jgi:hypothetical protein
MVEDEVRYLGAKAEELLAEYDRAKPDRGPFTFEDVERVWEAEVKPRIEDFECMKKVFGKTPPPPGNSRWRPHWDIPAPD